MLCCRGLCGRCGEVGDPLAPGREYHQGPVVGLRSWAIEEDMIGLQRPWHHTLECLGVVDQLRRHRVRGLFNLQMAGEHGYCGPGRLLPCGFSYDPEGFMEADGECCM